MSKVDDGGPAFPMPFDDRVGSYESSLGMTLRDYFAGRAIAGYSPGPLVPAHDVEKIARGAYRMADAMLVARAKGGEA